jgi:tRNA modification GTPase
MSLAQAEAVGALTSARSEQAAKAAARLLKGGLGEAVQPVRDHVVDALARVELQLDFAEDEAAVYSAPELASAMSGIADDLEALHDQYRAGRHLRHGALVVIAGAPNSGKSTLLNRIAGFERAIVSEIPGTTRDYLEVQLDWGGVPVRLVDTAGLWSSVDPLESEGTRRSEEMLAHADLVIWLMAPTDFVGLPNHFPAETPRLLVRSKSDLPGDAPDDIHLDLALSAMTGEGVETLTRRVAEELLAGYNPSEILVLEERQADHLARAAAAAKKSAELLAEEEGEEIIAEELRSVLRELADLVGETTADDLLNRIFSGFCIGK